jgi:hypothetical protein
MADRSAFPTLLLLPITVRSGKLFLSLRKLIAFVPHGPELSFSHLMYCVLPKIVCICFVRLFYFILFIYLFLTGTK